MHLKGSMLMPMTTEPMRPLLNMPASITPDTSVTVNGRVVEAHAGELLIDVLNRDTSERTATPLPQVCSRLQISLFCSSRAPRVTKKWTSAMAAAAHVVPPSDTLADSY